MFSTARFLFVFFFSVGKPTEGRHNRRSDVGQSGKMCVHAYGFCVSEGQSEVREPNRRRKTTHHAPVCITPRARWISREHAYAKHDRSATVAVTRRPFCYYVQGRRSTRKEGHVKSNPREDETARVDRYYNYSVRSPYYRDQVGVIHLYVCKPHVRVHWGNHFRKKKKSRDSCYFHSLHKKKKLNFKTQSL